jgi:HSP20 family protein
MRFDPFETAVDNLFRGVFRPVEWDGSRNRGTIPMDIYETDAAFVVTAELPGVRKDGINVRVFGNQLVIEAEAWQEKQAGEEAKVLLNERSYGKISRAVMLPVDIDQDHAEAHHEDGLLRLTLPKKADSVAKRLTVN